MQSKLTRRFFGAAVLAIGASACGTGGAPARVSGPEAQSAPPQQAYRLGPGDQLRVTVFGETELSGQFAVGPSGMMSYPLLGEIPAQGQTIPEFVAALAARLRAGYVREPNITAEVTNFRPFFILGEVGEPGTFAFTNNLTVMNAVAMANGFTYRADTRRVFIKRDGEVEEREYPLTSTIPVQPGDTIRIPERRF